MRTPTIISQVFDNDWRQIQEGISDSFEGHFGLFYSNGTLKEHFQQLQFTCNNTGRDENIQYRFFLHDVDETSNPISSLFESPNSTITVHGNTKRNTY